MATALISASPPPREWCVTQERPSRARMDPDYIGDRLSSMATADRWLSFCCLVPTGAARADAEFRVFRPSGNGDGPPRRACAPAGRYSVAAATHAGTRFIECASPTVRATCYSGETGRSGDGCAIGNNCIEDVRVVVHTYSIFQAVIESLTLQYYVVEYSVSADVRDIENLQDSIWFMAERGQNWNSCRRWEMLTLRYSIPVREDGGERLSVSSVCAARNSYLRRCSIMR